ncbi:MULTISPECIES: fimbrial biogenesis chaperone [unclassified Acinetobacter]|uniref:fimbrial biogenesis chaperone n=1 Tax=unclassified Acinetobacter TaxID=196816 RepID=UPI0025C24D7D|nr:MULTISPECIES: fimbria/pilus periplasmic chaperone [unclassified Acinetobacter]
MKTVKNKNGFLFALLTLIAPVAHADLTISPVQLYISGVQQQRSTTANLNTKGEKTDRTYEVSVFRWSQDEQGNDILTPDTELVVNPKALILKPDSNKVIRFGFRQSIEAMNLKQEATWRVKFIEIPSALQKTGMSIALNFSVPVFVGNGFQPDMSFHFVKDSKNNTVLVAKNNGKAHFQMTKFSLQDVSGKVLKDVDMMKYVLPDRQISIPLDGFHPASLKQLKFVMASANSKKSVIYDISEQ